ncbi:envelope protein UL43 [Beluga whale alphaherpesvirus 1]|uniref:Envelope protein UL43 n=1 Tax=Beluga whale alphaherpesvirus 1 TaxID=1434720 RepID=A0A286RUG5_9ALPH|nr:envelope protein UL43 [Beluga whale alphaherpesvirus 1]ASW27063.1 envelope protein UL43 [Beluga whale alphaherpesvirus 1]
MTPYVTLEEPAEGPVEGPAVSAAPLLISLRTLSCRGPKETCRPCLGVVSRAVFMIGVEAAVLAASVSLMTATIGDPRYAIPLLLGALLPLLLRVPMCHVHKLLVPMCNACQIANTIVIAGCWAARARGADAPAPLLVSASVSLMFWSAWNVYSYFTSAANGPESHAYGALCAITTGVFFGTVAVTYFGGSAVVAGFGFAGALVAASRDWGAELEDACYYRAARYVEIRSFADLGRAVKPDAPIGTTEESVSAGAALRGNCCRLLLLGPALVLAQMLWCLYYAFHLHEGMTGRQMIVFLLLCAACGHCVAVFCAYTISRLPGPGFDVCVLTHLLVQGVGAASLYVALNMGLGTVLLGSVSLTLVTCLHLLGRVSAWDRLALSYVCRGVYAIVYVSIGVCCILATRICPGAYSWPCNATANATSGK